MSDKAERISRIAGYEQFAADFAASSELQREAQLWLEVPMLEMNEVVCNDLIL